MSHAVKIYKIFEGVLQPEKAEEFVAELEGIQESTLTQTLKTLVTKEDMVRETSATKEDFTRKLAVTKEELRNEINTTKEELRNEINTTKEELIREIAKLKEEVMATKEELMATKGLMGEIRKLDVRIAEVKADIIKWMFLFWIGQVVSILTILKIARVF